MMTKQEMKMIINVLSNRWYDVDIEKLKEIDSSNATYDWMCKVFKDEFGFSADGSLPMYLNTLNEGWLDELYLMWKNNCEINYKKTDNTYLFVATPQNIKNMLVNLDRFYNIGICNQFEKIKQADFKKYGKFEFDKFTIRFFKNGNVRLKLV